MSNVRPLLSNVSLLRETPASRRFLLEAGQALLACQELEAAVHQLLAGMAVLRIGRLKPRNARAILNGTSKVSVGTLLAELRPHFKASTAWQSTVEDAIAARNHLIHRYFRLQLPQAMDPRASKAVLAEAARLRQKVRAGYFIIRPVVAALGAIASGAVPELTGGEIEAPNPSIERTSSGRLRLPTAAAHVER
jgi:hypothetical protein